MLTKTWKLYADTPEETLEAIAQHFEVRLHRLEENKRMGFNSKRSATENANEIAWYEREIRFLRDTEIDTKLNALRRFKEERKRREYDREWYRWLLGLREEMREDDIPF